MKLSSEKLLGRNGTRGFCKRHQDFIELSYRFSQLVNPCMHLQRSLQQTLPSLRFWYLVEWKVGQRLESQMFFFCGGEQNQHSRNWQNWNHRYVTENSVSIISKKETLMIKSCQITSDPHDFHDIWVASICFHYITWVVPNLKSGNSWWNAEMSFLNKWPRVLDRRDWGMCLTLVRCEIQIQWRLYGKKRSIDTAPKLKVALEKSWKVALPQTNSWLEVWLLSLWEGLFSGAMLVSRRVAS